MAQKRVTGTVTDTDGQPVIGATVKVNGSKVVGVTDADGKFVLPNVPASAKALSVSFIGMKTQEVAVSNNVSVVLAYDDAMLDEAIVVAYGVAKKGSFTGSVSQMKAKDLQKMQVANVSKGLEGQMAGVQITSASGQPGSSASINIRGIGSLSASDPLILLDGVPYDGDLNSINQADIESMSVQKDASATSIYGARAANGILIITTKKGREGKTQVNFDAKWGFSDRGVKPYQTVRSEGDYYELYWEAMRNQNLRLGMSQLKAGVTASQNLIKELGGYNAFNVADTELIDPLTGRIDPNARLLYHDDWDDEPYGTGVRQEYNASFSGGTEKTRYYVSLGYLDEKSYIKRSDFSRISGRVNLEHQVNNWLKVGVNASYSNTKSNYASSSNSMFGYTQGIAPIYPIYLRNADGSYTLDKNGNRQLDLGVSDGKARPYGNLGSNPYIDIYYNINDLEEDYINLRGFADVKLPIDGLTFHMNGAYDNEAAYKAVFQTPVVGDALAVNGRSTKSSGRGRNFTLSQRLNYSKDFGKWNMNLMAGHETLRRDVQNLSAQMTNFYIPGNPEFSNGVKPGTDPTSGKSRYTLESYFGRAEVSIADRYNLSASLRYDGSSKFHPDNRWGAFWSVGAAWRLSEEEFFQSSFLRDYVDQFKIKGSYGTQGNDGIGGTYALYLDQYTVSNVDGKPGISLSLRGNRDITWETSKNFNIGFESSFLKNRLMLEFDYFIKVTSDMLYARTVPPSLGEPSFVYDNGMEMQNEGVEMTLTGVLVKKQNFKWNASLNLTHYKNTINKVQPGKDRTGYDAGIYWRREGGGIYDWYMIKFAGVDPQTGDALYYKDVEKTGIVSDAEGNPVLDANGNKQYYNYTEVTTTTNASLATKYELGKSSIPDVYGGLSTSFEAYGFDLSISTAFQFGGYCYDNQYFSLMNSNAGSNYHIDMFKRWQKPGDITDVPKLENGNMNMTAGQTNDRFLVKSDYFSLKNVMIGYTVPKAWLKKYAGIESLRIYAVGDNLFLGAKRYGLDPRQNLTGDIDGGVYSAMRTISFGVNVAF